MHFLIEETKEGQKAYKTIVTEDPKAISSLNTSLAQQILKELAKSPSCAMDLARKLKQHEQKVYYHIRNFERLGLVKLERVEERVGATAKVYSTVSEAISYKIIKDSFTLDKKTRAGEIRFLHPFIEKGKMNSIIVVGSPDPHGKYKSPASDGYCGINLAMFFGKYLDEFKIPSYKLDTQVTTEDAEKNLIIIGGPKANIFTDKINKYLPIYFDYSEEFKDWVIVSSLTRNVYRDKYCGVIIRSKNPFHEGSEIILLAGKGFSGSNAAVIGLCRYITQVSKGNSAKEDIIAKVVRGVDLDSDGIIDDVEFLE